MFRLSKVTDYGIRILAHLARDEELRTPGSGRQTLHHARHYARHNAREVSTDLALPLPMVSKVMKNLARAGVLESHRGDESWSCHQIDSAQSPFSFSDFDRRCAPRTNRPELFVTDPTSAMGATEVVKRISLRISVDDIGDV